MRLSTYARRSDASGSQPAVATGAEGVGYVFELVGAFLDDEHRGAEQGVLGLMSPLHWDEFFEVRVESFRERIDGLGLLYEIGIGRVEFLRGKCGDLYSFVVEREQLFEPLCGLVE